MHLAYVARSKTRRHRLHALALNRKHEAFGVVLDGNHPIRMSGNFCQAIQINLEARPLTRKILLAKAHSFNVLPNNFLHQNNQNVGTKLIIQ